MPRTDVTIFGGGLLALLVLIVVVWPSRNAEVDLGVNRRSSSEVISPELAQQVMGLRKRENEIASSLWATELQGQRLNRRLEAVWDEVKSAKPKWAAVKRHSFGNILMGRWNMVSEWFSPPLEVWRSDGGDRSIAASKWTAFVRDYEQRGWNLDYLELRHTGFYPNEVHSHHRSRVRVAFALENPLLGIRAFVDGVLVLEWQEGVDSEPPVILSCDCRDLELRVSRGEPVFELAYEEVISPPENSYSIDPLLVSDLDGDGRSEVILAAKNLVLRPDRNNSFREEPLCTFPPGLISTALLADLDLDGAMDLICVKYEGMVVLKGSSRGNFDQGERMIWERTEALKYPMVLSGGDFDGDGDIDLFLGQYRVPYEGGALPTPFFDANDGYPSYLLRNNGNLEFTDVTAAAGLSLKRHRRVYSASFVDMDGKAGSDLVVVSDFAGADYYLNDGRGGFQDQQVALLPDAFGFGMAHTFSDFNRDGKLDFLMAGMTSPTVERLESLGLFREGLMGDKKWRTRMTYGTRLFLSNESGGYTQPPVSESLRRSGWSWGSSAADFNNDGFVDCFIGNGLESRDSVQDYESEYWLHDAFVADSEPDSVAYLYFKEKFGRTRGSGHSYGGYEHDRLYLNQAGASFVDVGYLLGVGAQRDSRNVVTEDLNGDGKMDLLVTSFMPWPDADQTLRIYLNRSEGGGQWIGFWVDAQAGSPSPLGAQIRIRAGNGTWVNEIVSGDSYRSQHSNLLHFGLGSLNTTVQATVRWPDGMEQEIAALETDRYYRVTRSDHGLIIGTE